MSGRRRGMRHARAYFVLPDSSRSDYSIWSPRRTCGFAVASLA
ncbi:hypothetical protein OH687_35215 [Burkholderia anthina]|nr:hypothetical protein OH687_35215 [Burkholderia anthina]